MGKIRFFLKKLAGMDYKAMVRTAKTVHLRSGKGTLPVLLDIARCGIAYQAGYSDYELFHMETLTEEERKIILTCGKNNEYVRTLNDPAYRRFFSDKAEFNRLFGRYLGRRWLLLNERNAGEFRDFTEGLDRIVVKPLSLSCGRGIEILPLAGKEPAALHAELLANGQTLAEEVLVQREEIAALYPHAVNTLRLVTVRGESGAVTVVGSYIRIGAGGNTVDNFNHGGLASPVNPQTGVISHPARNKRNETFTVHPDTGAPLLGFRIPGWDGAMTLARELAGVVPQMRYVGWDICLTPDGPVVVEGNEYPGNDLYQIPREHIGTCDLIEEALKK